MFQNYKMKTIFKLEGFMNSKSEYKTKQREDILSYLQENEGKHITVNDVYEHLKEKNLCVGQTTIYRNLEKLVDNGLVNKYIVDINMPACFEYINPESHVCNDICFHMRCEKCGTLIHTHCDELKSIISHIQAEHNFILDPKRTVLYGICDRCRES